MAFNMISKVVNGVKGGVVGALKGSADIGSASVKVLRDLTVNTVKGAGDITCPKHHQQFSMLPFNVEFLHTLKIIGICH